MLSQLSSHTRSCAILATRRRLSRLSNKELLRNVANANLAAANVAGGAANVQLSPHVPHVHAQDQQQQQHQRSGQAWQQGGFPLHIL